MTNHFSDAKNSDLIVVCGSNNAENHPASMRWINAARQQGAKYIVIDPRFTRSAAAADFYSPIRQGSDIVFLGAMVKYILDNDLWNEDYVKTFTNASYLVNPDFAFNDGEFTGLDEDGRKYDTKSWSYQVEETKEWDTAGAFSWAVGENVPSFTTPKVPVIKKDPTLQDPNCVFQLMKKQYVRYTPEMVEAVCGMPRAKFEEIAEMWGATGANDKAAVFMYAMGLAQHSKGAQNIRAISLVQTLLGNIGRAGGGINALRGESNVQGSTDWGLLFGNLPSYLSIPSAGAHPNLTEYLNKTTNYAGYWSNRPKFLISQLKEWWGEHATLENDFCYDYMPKIEAKDYSHISIFEDMDKGVIKGLFLWGQNPAVGGPNGNFERGALEKLDWMVAVDLWETDTAGFWKRPGVDPASINTEVFLLPACGHYEKWGTVANSGRWIQWRWKAVDPPGEAIDDGQIMSLLLQNLQELYKSEGGAFPDPIVNLHWPYMTDGHFDAVKAAKGMNGYDVKTGKLLTNFTQLKFDGSTACAGWIYSGYFNNNDSDDPADQPCGSRDNSDPTVHGLEGGLSQFVKWSFAWPLNRRIIYNRGSADSKGQPYDPSKPIMKWDGEKWLRNDVPDFGFQAASPDDPKVMIGTPPEKTVGFMMNNENVARLFAPGMKEGPFPEHYEPYESPTDNAMSSRQVNPCALFYPESSKLGTADEYPLAVTTFRLVEHWQAGAMTRNLPWSAQAQPHMFVEISEELAAERGIENGDWVEVFNNRGNEGMYAMVTKRLKPMEINGKTTHIIAMPWHWGWSSPIIKGATANSLTPHVGDANTSIPEYKAFLADIRKAVKK